VLEYVRIGPWGRSRTADLLSHNQKNKSLNYLNLKGFSFLSHLLVTRNKTRNLVRESDSFPMPQLGGSEGRPR